MAFQYQVLPSGSLECNSIVIWDDASREAVLVDPTDDARTALDFIERQRLTVKYLLATHGHFDHTADAERAMEQLGLRLRLHRLDHGAYQRIPQNAAMFGVRFTARTQPIDELVEGETFTVSSGLTLQTLAVPGHTEGSVAFYVPEGPWVFAGDTLFAGSVGRTDLPGGSFEQLTNSVLNVLYHLPNECVVIPGHGPTTTIGREKRDNGVLRMGDVSKDWL
jgi:glyoxylase-like metal-dependent hydrolase (beta-lactamase superfamily II)